MVCRPWGIGLHGSPSDTLRDPREGFTASTSLGAATLVLAQLAYVLISHGLKCGACGQPVFNVAAPNRPHPHAKKFFGVSFRLQVAREILTAETYKCIHCHSACRCRRKISGEGATDTPTSEGKLGQQKPETASSTPLLKSLLGRATSTSMVGSDHLERPSFRTEVPAFANFTPESLETASSTRQGAVPQPTNGKNGHHPATTNGNGAYTQPNGQAVANVFLAEPKIDREQPSQPTTRPIANPERPPWAHHGALSPFTSQTNRISPDTPPATDPSDTMNQPASNANQPPAGRPAGPSPFEMLLNKEAAAQQVTDPAANGMPSPAAAGQPISPFAQAMAFPGTGQPPSPFSPNPTAAPQSNGHMSSYPAMPANSGVPSPFAPAPAQAAMKPAAAPAPAGSPFQAAPTAAGAPANPFSIFGPPPAEPKTEFGQMAQAPMPSTPPQGYASGPAASPFAPVMPGQAPAMPQMQNPSQNQFQNLRPAPPVGQQGSPFPGSPFSMPQQHVPAPQAQPTAMPQPQVAQAQAQAPQAAPASPFRAAPAPQAQAPAQQQPPAMPPAAQITLPAMPSPTPAPAAPFPGFSQGPAVSTAMPQQPLAPAAPQARAAEPQPMPQAKAPAQPQAPQPTPPVQQQQPQQSFAYPTNPPQEFPQTVTQRQEPAPQAHSVQAPVVEKKPEPAPAPIVAAPAAAPEAPTASAAVPAAAPTPTPAPTAAKEEKALAPKLDMKPLHAAYENFETALSKAQLDAKNAFDKLISQISGIEAQLATEANKQAAAATAVATAAASAASALAAAPAPIEQPAKAVQPMIIAQEGPPSPTPTQDYDSLLAKAFALSQQRKAADPTAEAELLASATGRNAPQQAQAPQNQLPVAPMPFPLDSGFNTPTQPAATARQPLPMPHEVFPMPEPAQRESPFELMPSGASGPAFETLQLLSAQILEKTERAKRREEQVYEAPPPPFDFLSTQGDAYVLKPDTLPPGLNPQQ